MGNFFSNLFPTTEVQFCSPEKTRRCFRGEEELSCGEYHKCREKNGHQTCPNSPWLQKCGWDLFTGPVTTPVMTSDTVDTNNTVGAFVQSSSKSKENMMLLLGLLLLVGAGAGTWYLLNKKKRE